MRKETAIFIRQVLYLPLRPNRRLNEFICYVLMKAEITIPDFSSISSASITLPKHILTKSNGNRVVSDWLIPQTQVYGKDDGIRKKHDAPARRTCANCILRSMKSIKF